jgi:Uma2 family endonuclease
MAVLNPPRSMFEVFESLPEGTLCQLINNTLIMSPAPSDSHQKLLLEISAELLAHAKTNNLGEVRVAPYDVYLSKHNVYQPDIVFVASDNVKNIQEKGLVGAPDLVIEILSPKTAKYDFEDKKEVYERYGVKEYWLVDPVSKQITFFKLANNEYVEVETKSGIIKSPLLNTVIKF